MKICHFLMSLNPKSGGPATSVPIQCLGTQKMGAEMCFVTSNLSHRYTDKLVNSGVKLYEIKRSHSIFARYFALPLKNFFSSFDRLYHPDILHYHGVWRISCHRVAQYGKKHGIPYVVNPRGDLELYRVNNNKLKKLKKEIAWRLYVRDDLQRAACILVTSQQEADAVISRGVTSPIAIIPNGMDINDFPSSIHHILPEKRVVLFLSRVNPIKGLDILIDAWNQLPSDTKNNWELHIVGNSDPEGYEEILKQQVQRYGLQQSILFCGPLNGKEKIDKYSSASVFVLPTRNENFGNVVAEAMLCECPVITTKNAPWECIQENNLGWWIDLSVANLVKSLSEAMNASDEERLSLGKKSRQYIINHLSSDSVAKNTYELYEWILSKQNKPLFIHNCD